MRAPRSRDISAELWPDCKREIGCPVQAEMHTPVLATRHTEGLLSLDAASHGTGVSRRRVSGALESGWETTVAFDRITQDPNILAGRATIRGLRISVAHVVNLVANGMTPAQIVHELPDLEEEDVRQALAYAAALAKDEVHPLRA